MGALEIFEILVGGLLRFALPLVITLLVASFLKRLDDRWRVENLRETMAAAGVSGPVQNLRCWEAHGCSPERRDQCRANQNPDQPCWESFRVNGHLQNACKRCAFRQLKLSTEAS